MGSEGLTTYAVWHRTLLRYAGRVSLSYNEVRMRPRDRGRQFTHSFKLNSAPLASPRGRIDHFGNYVQRLDVTTPHDRLDMQVEAVVQNGEPRRRRLLPWTGDRLATDPRLEFALASPRVPLGGAPAALYREWNGDDRDPDALLATAVRMGDEFRYVVGATTVESTIEDLLSGGAGVCQDFAHLFLAMVRGAGWPARYVSGYLGPTGDETVAEGESHAWVEICGADGRWVGVDPTHGGYTGVHHLSLAIGRDYADVAPHRGVFYGDGTGLRPEVSVRVSLTPPQEANVVHRGEAMRWQYEQQQQLGC